MDQAGLWSIGFGVDGTSKKVWRSIKKGHNNLDECIEAIRLTREEFGIVPEIFMVIGHEEDTPEVLAQDIEFTLDMVDRFGATPRPYVAKNIVPGNSGWKDPKNQEYVEKLIEHPDNFFALEYGALPSPLTHPNRDMREAIKNAFHMLASIPGNTTEIIYPISADIKENVKNIYLRLNEGKFDR